MSDQASWRRALIVNADDFGYSAAVNAGVVEAFERGVVSSASLMVRWPGARDAADYARGHPELSVGLHLDLGHWVPPSGDALYQHADLDDRDAVETEARSQLELFRELVAAAPTHLDSHQHVHWREPCQSVARELAGRLEVPLRGLFGPIHYCGDFYGHTEAGEPRHEAITAEHLIRLIQALPNGATEIACHPARALGDDPYARESELEIDALCDRRVRVAIRRAGVALCSFRDLDDHGRIG